jgi:hypothetical protein
MNLVIHYHTSRPRDQRSHGGLTTMLPRPRGGVISIATAPLLLHDRHLVQDKQRWRGHSLAHQDNSHDDQSVERLRDGAKG